MQWLITSEFGRGQLPCCLISAAQILMTLHIIKLPRRCRGRFASALVGNTHMALAQGAIDAHGLAFTGAIHRATRRSALIFAFPAAFIFALSAAPFQKTGDDWRKEIGRYAFPAYRLSPHTHKLPMVTSRASRAISPFCHGLRRRHEVACIRLAYARFEAR